ncbi:hypothetical protein P691DRAFT_772674 [Macrolepiota fuliginosa MF-IS2]|uniref:Mitochondrial intermembrane space import and assembly protein 40 n=1 Tax=Macrolepiota fuliginosa MF-IS2 TaxID=1400762 RepID=A0A9P5XK88_9AGAR|nr:hypothetical protein P691DRAFT_772674 [Macrolepiota fuliginosa MF-IS2]
MATYASYTPNASAGHSYRTPHYQTSPVHRHEQHHQTQRSALPRDATPTPTIRGKPVITSQGHYYQRTGYADSPRPYQQMSQTYSWVLEQEYMRRDREKRCGKTQQWVFEQQTLYPGETLRNKNDFPPAWEEKTRDQMWDELVTSYELEADRWMRQEEEIRRLAAERERKKARYVQEELKRLEARMRVKREAERHKVVEEKLRAQMDARERDRKDRTNAQKVIVDAWNRYESGWEAVNNSTTPLGFSDIPWPTKLVPSRPCDITPSAVATLLLSPFHSPKQTRKERTRSAQLRWHPDRFRRLLSRVKEEDKEAIEEGVGIIARCLNDLMSKETTARPRTRFARVAIGASAVAGAYLAWRSLSDPIASTQSLQKPTASSEPPSKASVRSSSDSTPETSSIPNSEPSSEPSGSLESSKDNSKGPSSKSEEAVEQQGEGEGEEGSKGAPGGAFNPETGEINWDCPCLGGMAHGPCGPEFREAFSCFVFSEQEPKGIDCVEKFQAMQDCFRRHPDVYSDEIMDDDEEEVAANAPEGTQAAPEAEESPSSAEEPTSIPKQPSTPPPTASS